MKKYFFGISSLLLAIGFSAFTAKTPNFVDNQVFKLKSGVSVTAGEAILETLSSWQFEGVLSSTPRCDDIAEKACKLIVDVAHKTGTAFSVNVVIDAVPGILDDNGTPLFLADDVQYYMINTVTAPSYVGDVSNSSK